MHIFLENVRTEVERLSGKDAYLSASIFQRIWKGLDYEKENGEELKTQKDFEKVIVQAMNTFNQPESWNLQEEILSWQTSVLRDVSREFYHNWEKVLRERFLAPSKFRDGSGCMVLESFCEEADLDPTSVYTKMIDLLVVATRLCTAANTVINEIKRLNEFEENFLDKHSSNQFLKKRFDSQFGSTLFSGAIQQMENMLQICKENAAIKGSVYFVHWEMAREELESFLVILRAFLDYRKSKNFELELVEWVKVMFPERFSNGRRNLLWESQLHHEIVTKLTSVTSMLYLYVAKNEKSVFLKRDEVIRSNLTRIFEERVEKEMEERKKPAEDCSLHQRIMSRRIN